MDRRIVSKMGKVAALAAVLALQSGCQDLNSLVTGEKFLLAPKESPRVEVEVDFVVHEAFYASLEGVDREALEAEMQEIALSMADVGLRFYPVPSDAYERGDARPERRMVVEVSDLAITIDEKTIEEEGQPLRIVASVQGVTCTVHARVEKRREDGPALVVGTGEALGKTRVQAEAGELPVDVRADAVGYDGLFVDQEDLLDAFEEGAVDALRAVVKAVDRDLVMESTP